MLLYSLLLITMMLQVIIGIDVTCSFSNTACDDDGGACSCCTLCTSSPCNMLFDSSVNHIYSESFSYCSSLTSIVIPTTVTYIGEGAFSGCEYLTTVTILTNVTSIPDYAFSGCIALMSITIPTSVTYIGTSSFQGCFSLTSFTIPTSVTWIGPFAFNDCIYLTSVTIPTSVTIIDVYAFNHCNSLTSVQIPTTVTSIGRGAFNGCSSLVSVTIPTGVTSIDPWTFEGCSSLVSVSIPTSVTSIGGFKGCTSLISVTIPTSVTSMGDNAFEGCTSLKSMAIPGVTYIGDQTFKSCTSLEEIIIPTSATYIGQYAFSRCYSLTFIQIPTGVKSIGTSAFEGCTSLKYANISAGVTSIARAAFVYCISLKMVIIPNSVTSMGEGAFYQCISLTSITISSRIQTISDYTFFGCSNLTSVVIPDGVTTIGYAAFQNCTTLTRLTIPTTVKVIGGYAFQGCPIPCLYSWNPTTSRTVATTAGLSTMTACPCDYGTHIVDYVCSINQPSPSPTTSPTNVPDKTGEIVGIVIPCVCLITIMFVIVLRLIKRRRYNQFKVFPVFPTDDKVQNIDSNKFDSQPQYFKLGGIEDYKDGLTKKIVGGLYRSMEEECTTNEDGKWKDEFDYIVNQPAFEQPDPFYSHRIRDKGHAGMTLKDFLDDAMAIAANLNQAEVVALRLYTGPIYVPWNTALRLYDDKPHLLLEWQTSLSILYSAVFKLSFLSKPGTVYRGVNESRMKLPEAFYRQDGNNFAGGVELAFMSTTYDINVATEYLSRGTTKEGTIFEIEFDAGSRGARVQWVSQYPYEEELLYPPCTFLTCKSVNIVGGIRHVAVSASVSTARPDLKNIKTVTDNDKDNDCLDRLLDALHL